MWFDIIPSISVCCRVMVVRSHTVADRREAPVWIMPTGFHHRPQWRTAWKVEYPNRTITESERWHTSLKEPTVPDSKIEWLCLTQKDAIVQWATRNARGEETWKLCHSSSGSRPPRLFNVYICLRVHLINLPTKSNDRAPTGSLQICTLHCGIVIIIFNNAVIWLQPLQQWFLRS